MAVRPEKPMDVLRWLHRRRVLAYGGAFVGTLVFFSAVAIGPKQAHIRKTRLEIDRMKSFLAGTQETIRRLKDIEALLSERRLELENLKRRTIKEGGEAALIETFTQATDAEPIMVLNIAPHSEPAMLRGEEENKTPWQHEGFQKKLLGVHLQCRYQTLGLLLEELERADLIFKVEEMYLKKSGALAPNLDINLTLAAFSES